ncbi:retrotransposon hot spot (RHS) protein, partial [Trypanosoma conorhini]
GWEKQNDAMRIIMNCPDELDVKAMCAWERRVESAEAQLEYWKTVKKYMDDVGPVLRCIFSGRAWKKRSLAANDEVGRINALNADYYMRVEVAVDWAETNASHKLVKIVRLVISEGIEKFYNGYLTTHFANIVMTRVSEVKSLSEMMRMMLLSRSAFVPALLERVGKLAFTFESFLEAVKDKYVELVPGRTRTTALRAERKHCTAPHQRC